MDRNSSIPDPIAMLRDDPQMIIEGGMCKFGSVIVSRELGAKTLRYGADIMEKRGKNMTESFVMMAKYMRIVALKEGYRYTDDEVWTALQELLLRDDMDL